MSLALIIDDEVDLCRLMQMALKKMQINSIIAYDFATAKDYILNREFDFCLTDLRLPDGSGLDIVKLINEHSPRTPVAVITAHGSTDLGIEALKLGAFDFVNKPLELPRLRLLVENALKVAQDKLHAKTDTPDPFAGKLIGQSATITTLKQTIQKLARSQAPVFLWGESGSGKEVVAKLIHELSPRKLANFVAVNCGAIPSELMESEFFGHKKGSFTGATADKEGLFQQANGGTLFLDEVADLPLAMQVKLLRAIQEKKIRPIGGMQEIAVDIRLLSATHKNLAKLVEQGDFRQDLYYRINVIEVKLPSLNERKSDIPLLAGHFLQLIANDWGLEQQIELTKSASQALLQHHYLGNVRELRNILERAITLSDGHVIEVQHLNLQRDKQTPSHVQNTAANTIYPTTKSNNNHNNHNNNRVNHATVPNPINHIQNIATQQQTTIPQNQAQDHGLFGNYTQGIFGNHSNTSVSITPPRTAERIIQTLPPIIGKIMPSIATNNERRYYGEHPLSKHYPEGTGFDTLPKEGLEEYLNDQERRLIITALQKSDWNKTSAAKKLGMSFRSLRYRLKKLGLEDE
ncbi:two component sigma-54 specific Fis family transcriptional regulator [Moraxella macacae 0408225]|uniref:Two component sigma-54 specific Fis family transcriptional regulator n=1 Tax=Moraxella macacae 0408225 TaxID=1230338 RepID=L2F5G7_9GAMM|nr:sigma-54 dependent transcriptional regulator [Moraxella macacae]ELA08125.1 two component sigma-54 specific Fis family transcriptional regulator [Moraxella macacae 0408225]